MCSHHQPEDLCFGDKAWVYCQSHMRPHETGWCTVPAADKVLLESTNETDAIAECKVKGLKLYEYPNGIR